MKRRKRELAKLSKRSQKSKRNQKKKASSFERTPSSADDLFSRTAKFQEKYNRAVQVPAEMRANNLALRQAARNLNIGEKVVLRLAGQAFRKLPNGQYRVKPRDKLLRVMLTPGPRGNREIATNDSREASLIGQHWSAIEYFLQTGDDSRLRQLPGKTVRDSKGKRVRLLLDRNELVRQASAGVLRFESLYGRSV